MRRRSNIEVFSLSFLDCICCGFGALILLLVLAKNAEPVIFEEYSDSMKSIVVKLQEELFDIRGETYVLNRDLVSKQQQISKEKIKVARLQGDLSAVLGEFSASSDDSTVQNIVTGQLTSARQQLTEEMQRLQAQQINFTPPDNTVGGIPVDSEYIIFIIDTSGSMFRFAWDLVKIKITEVLDAYPKVKGIQVMNDMGEFMFSQYAGDWIPDTPARRKAIITRMKRWQPFSNSSPVEGINAAIRIYYAKDKKISLYVLGDEFTGESISNVVHEVDRINRKDSKGNRRVRIHAIGFPVQFDPRAPDNVTGVRFATLMRELCKRNDGTFIGLNSFSP
ncbi:MAG: VWA domain-containing protein [Gammaproteobacteria bacterium]